MRRRFMSRTRDEAEASLTPMLDIVFILLIFFIVTATFTRESAIAIEPPPPQTVSETPKPATTVEIDVDGLVRIDGRLTDIGAVTAGLQRIAAETPDRPVIIQAHPQANSGSIVLVRDQVYDANVQSVNLTLSAVD